MLRSPGEKLGRYILLPRTIDKVRLHDQGQLPSAYHGNLLKPGFTLDGQLLAFTGLDGSELREIILTQKSDKSILAWVESQSGMHSEEEVLQWTQSLQTFRVSPLLAKRLRTQYPGMPPHLDFTAHSLFDLIDMDEGRRPVPDAS
ncbi:DUF5069 domain-containing protein [Nitrospira sp. M1]